MPIRKTKETDLERVLAIYAFAREQMKKSGNPNQWKDNRPPRETVERDIRISQSYVIEEEGEIVGVFALIFGKDPTYSQIDGAWLNGEPYVTLHRIASSGKRGGILKDILSFAEALSENVRVDTHRDNLIMQRLLKRFGYTQCGVIVIEDGSERIAFQKKTFFTAPSGS